MPSASAASPSSSVTCLFSVGPRAIIAPMPSSICPARRASPPGIVGRRRHVDRDRDLRVEPEGRGARPEAPISSCTAATATTSTCAVAPRRRGAPPRARCRRRAGCRATSRGGGRSAARPAGRPTRRGRPRARGSLPPRAVSWRRCRCAGRRARPRTVAQLLGLDLACARSPRGSGRRASAARSAGPSASPARCRRSS